MQEALGLRPSVLSFLHTAEIHVAAFTRIARELDSDVPIRHAVRADLFARALADGGVSEETRLATRAEVLRLIGEGATVVVCTCSTLGKAAEETPHTHPVRVLRIDRPMAERAVALGRPVLVVAATSTAMASAVGLLQSAAEGRPLEYREMLCDVAWLRFQAGDPAGYAALVAEAVEDGARTGEVVMLAQASMEPAAASIRRRDIEVLTSPRLAVRAALSERRRAG